MTNNTDVVDKCIKGCLMCENEKCTVCDLKLGYYLDTDKCKLAETTVIDKCLYIANDGKCAQCDQNYYFDSSASKCATLTAEQQVAGCLYYDANKNCISCSDSYYYKTDTKKCIEVTTKIDNCISYSLDESVTPAKIICQLCQKGYSFDFDNLKCVATSLTNCASYTYLNCLTCGTAYYYNPNYYLIGRYTKSTAPDLLKATTGVIGASKWTLSTTCPAKISNCVTMKGSNTCEICSDGYYTTGSACVLYSQQSFIPNCLWVNAGKTACLKCVSGYYLLNGVCTIIVPISNCQDYEQMAASTTTCISCIKDYYLDQTLGKCSQRSLPDITNCSVYDKFADNCKTCSANYTLSTDKYVCLKQIENCLIYNPFDISESSIFCTQCAQEYYLDGYLQGNSCKKGTVANCQKYTLDQNICIQCKDGFYIKNGVCQSSTLTTNCAKADPGYPNLCSACKPGYLNFLVEDVCQVADTTDNTKSTYRPLITNCAEYTQDGFFCKKCATGYLLSQEGVCTSTTCTCLEYNDSFLCTKCSSNCYIRDNFCYIFWVAADEHCSTLDSNNLLNDFFINKKVQACESCVNNYMPFKFNNAVFCLSQAQKDSLGLSETLVANCDVYSTDQPHICLICKATFFIDVKKNECVSSCQAYAPSTFDGFANVCLEITSTICKEYFQVTVTDFDAENYIDNFKCMKYYDSIADSSKLYLHFNESFTYRIPFKYDKSDTSVTFPFLYEGFLYQHDTNLASSTITDCEIQYKSTTQTNYICLKCIDTKVLQLGINNDGYSCIPEVADCNTTFTSIEGLPAYLNAIIGCKKCTTADNIIALQFEISSTTATPSSFADFKLRSTAAAQALAIQDCIASNGLTIEDNTTNCYIVAQIYDSDNTTTKNYCLACAQGYQPTYQTTGYLKNIQVTACSTVSDCLFPTSTTTVYVNRCPDCGSQTGKHFDYKAQSCIDSASVSCFMFQQDTSKGCLLCNPGQYLTPDFKCQAITLTANQFPNCTTTIANSIIDVKQFKNLVDPMNISNSSFQQYMIYQLRAKASISLYDQAAANLNFGVYGCAVCTGTDTMKLNSPANGLTSCIDTTTGFDTIAKITDCQNYYTSSDGEILCFACATGKLLSSNFIKCGTYGDINPNCAIADIDDSNDFTTCIKCKSGYALNELLIEANKCVQIQNCAKFSNDVYQVCLQCNSGYYLAEDYYSCIQGGITNCDSYIRGVTNKCSKCQDGFFLLRMNTQDDICLALQADWNCLQVEDIEGTGSNMGMVRCIKCKAEAAKIYFIQNVDNIPTQNYNQCYSFLNSSFKVTNCADYDQYAQIPINNTLKCTKCEDKKKLNNNTCSDFATLANCSERSYESETCLQCSANYFIQNGSCVNYVVQSAVSNIDNCRVYTSSTQCRYCKKGYYVLEGKCVDVPPNLIQTNCKTYGTLGFCIECEADYVLKKQNICTFVIAKDCLTYLDERTCGSCPSGKGLKKTGDITDCVTVTMSDSCAIMTKAFPFTCETCLSNYYLNSEKKCIAVTTQITDCLYYASATTCKQCKESYYTLSSDQTKCENKIPPTITVDVTSCIKYELLTLPSCSACNNGYYIQDNKCVPCNADNNCFGCLSDGKCIVCNSGFYMNTDSKCVQNE